MWIPTKFFTLFTDTKEEVAKLKAERDSYRDELARVNISNDWLRLQINQLQNERGALLAKAYGIHVAVPELVRSRINPSVDSLFDRSLFEEEAPSNLPNDPTAAYRPKLG